ncbi:hypothetical protein [Maridesulfovibrio salexigens]|uniref:Uncharacterized protein n=1 Tax=Maridesulfovibrio salexigens (strain ATCC 14822 / DSM 2638 / NCIMB 8403 / VKM B-1763) TaxID=526222 RepID=C6BWP4_MARSD|nr:hypothetical protein [Maridesulfovibrio salexigens]ACS80324.1 hypothetical protein Desal_2268 [Maridesulfovibrio salexigens DSM 2638]
MKIVNYILTMLLPKGMILDHCIERWFEHRRIRIEEEKVRNETMRIELMKQQSLVAV